MQNMRLIVSLFLLLLFFHPEVFAQDSTAALMKRMEQKIETKKDSSFKKKVVSDTVERFNPTTATIRSAIIPGWGQAYNKKYWKIPLVYGALGTTAGIFFYNLRIYNLLRVAYRQSLADSGFVSSTNPYGTANDQSIDPRFRNFPPTILQSDRNIFRQNIDYSVLFFLFFWGLNVVDATVDAHLKGFDVGSDLSLQIKPGYSPFANTNGISLVLNLDRKHM